MHHNRIWQFQRIGEPFASLEVSRPEPVHGEVLIRVVGCGVCHTDLGYLYDGVRTVKSLPLVLGHEISGMVEKAGRGVEEWLGQAVVVPAILPCGECELCRSGKRAICREQKMPGNHIDGGFATHLVVPSRYLCPVPVRNENETFGDSGVTLKELSVVADAVTTPYMAIKKSGLTKGDLAIFIGVGGIGGFGVQLANAIGATVVAVDVSEKRLEFMKNHGASMTYNPKTIAAKELRKAIQGFAQERKLPAYGWKIFETSGTAAGQETAFGLLTFGAHLAVVGYTMDQPAVRLSNLMAFDATAAGNWGCDPELYPEVLALVRSGAIQLEPFVELHPLNQINNIFERAHAKKLEKRAVLVPEK